MRFPFRFGGPGDHSKPQGTRLGFLGNAVLTAVAAKVWNVSSGIVSIFLITRLLSPKVQGYYYVVLSLGALQMLAELGISVTITTFVNHEMNGTQLQVPIVGSPESIGRLGSLFSFQRRWFRGGAIAICIVVMACGWLFLGANESGVLPALGVYSIGLSLGLVTEGKLAFLLGAGRSVSVSRHRLTQAVCSSVALWVGLYFNLELYSIGFAQIASFGIVYVSLRYRFDGVFGALMDFHRHWGKAGVSWIKEIWPFQWKVGLSFIGGYFLSQSLTPVVLRMYGPEVAGRFGLSMQIVVSLNAVAFVWISVKSSDFARLISAGDLPVLRRRFQSASVGSTLLMFSSLVVVVLSKRFFAPSWLAERVLPDREFVWLCLLGFGNHLVFSISTFLRALRTDPLWFPSLLQGATTMGIALLFPGRSVAVVLIAMTIGFCTIMAPASVGLFLRSWHSVFSSKKSSSLLSERPE
jgi:hypothetical protein